MSGGGGSKEQTVGYRYYIGMHMGVCAGPVDSVGQIRVGDRVVWSGDVTTSQQLYINQPTLFGGDEREGGVVGSLDVMMGDSTQSANTYLSAKQTGPQPSYRGFLGMVFRGGMVAANNPYLKPWKFLIKRILKGWDGSVFIPSKAGITVGTVGETTYTEYPSFELTLDANINNSTDGSNGITFTGLNPDYEYVVRIREGAWSFTGTDYYLGPNWSTWYKIITDTGTISAYPTQYGTSAEAWAAYQAGTQETIFTGTTQATFFLWDALVQDNRGRMFLTVTPRKQMTGVNVVAMNPAHIVYECLTNTEWGMGYSPSNIDTTSFTTAANTFYDEGMGLCLMWTRQDSIESFIQTVVSHAGAVLGQDRRTGLFILKAIRGGYTVGSLPLFDEGNVIALDSYQRASLVEAVNEVTVNYTDATTGNTGSVTVQNLANITSQGGVVAQTKNYPGLPTASLAARVAMRDLVSVSTPIARIRMRVNREGYSLIPGDVIRFSWAKLGITDLVLRVLAVNTGTLTNGEITIDASEDVYGMPATTYAAAQSSGWQEPNNAPAPAAYRLVGEAGYYELARVMSSTELAAVPVDAGYMSYVAARPSSDSISFKIMARVGSSGSFSQVGLGQFAPSATITASIGQAATSATLTNMVDVDMVEAGGYAVLGGTEIIRVDTINKTTGAITFGRGVLDSVAIAHGAGARIFFVQGYLNTDGIERLDADNVQVHLLPSTARGTLIESSAPTDSIILDQRHYRPYPPGRLRINATAYPASLVDVPLTFSWAHRNRLQQNLEGDETGNIGPEAGTTYTIALYKDATNTLIQQITGITGTSQTIVGPTGTNVLRVELWSVRSTLASRQKHVFTFSYTNITRISTESLDHIVTEAGDAITTE